MFSFIRACQQNTTQIIFAMVQGTFYCQNSSMNITPKLACHLILLPPEIRDSIYSLVVTQSGPSRPNTACIFKRIQDHETGVKSLSEAETVLALARTCTQAHNEVLSICFGRNRFEFQDTYSLYVYLYMIGRERRELVRDIELWWHGVCQEEACALLGECRDLKR